MDFTLELKPINRKSFYGKCEVKKTESHLTLFSYKTKVATFREDLDNSLWITKSPEYLTQTTLRHINAFLVYIGKDTMTKKEILNFNL